MVNTLITYLCKTFSTNTTDLKQFQAPDHTNAKNLRKLILFMSFQFSYKVSTMFLEDINPDKYHTCVYDNKWYIGNAVEVSNTNQDIYFKFMNKSKSNKEMLPILTLKVATPQNGLTHSKTFSVVNKYFLTEFFYIISY